MKTLFTVFIGLLCAASSATAAESGLSTVDIRHSPYEYQLSVQDKPGSGLLIPGAGLALKAREIVAAGSSEVTAAIHSPIYPDGTTLSLGHFEAGVILRPFLDGSYQVEFSMALRLPEGGTKSLQLRTVTDGKKRLFEKNFSQDFSRRFAALVRAEFFSFEAMYGAEFAGTLSSFSSQYADKVLAELPSLVKAMIQKDEDFDKTVSVQSTSSEIQAAAFSKRSRPVSVTLRQENYQRDEELNIISESENGVTSVVPERISATTFGLSDMNAATHKRENLGTLEYYVATARLSSGQLRTIFTCAIVYREQPKVSYTVTLLHGPKIDETVFFPRWKGDFLGPAMDKFIMAATSEEDRVQRSVFVSYLEPYLYDEYYDLSPFLTKAMMSFDHPSTRKRIDAIVNGSASSGPASSKPPAAETAAEEDAPVEYLSDTRSPNPGP